MPAIDYLSAIANQLNQRRVQRQGTDQVLQQALMKAKIDQQTNALDPSNILSQLELKAIVDKMRAGSQGIQQGISPQIQGSQTLPTQQTQSNIPQLGPTQSDFGQSQLSKPQIGQQQQSRYELVPSKVGTGKYGEPDISYKSVLTPEAVKQEKVSEKIATEGAEAITKSRAAERMTLINLGKLGGQVNELSEIYAGAIKEGGFGNIIKKKLSELRLGFGGKQADKLKQTAAYSGVLTEVVAAIMPTLTQQGDEKGSVRLVESVFRKIRESFPEGHQYAGTAQNMIRTSLRNGYRKAKIINEMSLSNEYIDKLSEKDLTTLSDKINKMADNITIKKGSAESKALNNFINQSTQPLLKILNEDVSTQKQKFKPGFVNKPKKQKQSVQNIQEGQTAFNPKTNERIIFKNGRWVPKK